MSEMKPCPFCGGKNVLSTELQDGLPFIAYCQCGAENEAENWNNRPIEDKLRKRIAELEAKKDILENQLREATNFLIDKKLHVDSLYEDGFKLQKRIAELEAAQRWIPVSERLPEDRATVLAAFKNREILTATYYKHYEGFGGVENYWHIEGWHSGNVTHWMPLPQLPEERER